MTTLERITELRALLKHYEQLARLEARATALEGKAGQLTKLGASIATLEAAIADLEE